MKLTEEIKDKIKAYELENETHEVSLKLQMNKDKTDFIIKRVAVSCKIVYCIDVFDFENKGEIEMFNKFFKI